MLPGSGERHVATKETMKDTQTSTMALAGTPTTTKHTRSHVAHSQDQENDTTKETMKDTQTSTMALAGTPTTTNAPDLIWHVARIRRMTQQKRP